MDSKLVIVVRGGCVTGVYVDGCREDDVVIVDWDNATEGGCPEDAVRDACVYARQDLPVEERLAINRRECLNGEVLDIPMDVVDHVKERAQSGGWAKTLDTFDLDDWLTVMQWLLRESGYRIQVVKPSGKDLLDAVCWTRRLVDATLWLAQHGARAGVDGSLNTIIYGRAC